MQRWTTIGWAVGAAGVLGVGWLAYSGGPSETRRSAEPRRGVTTIDNPALEAEAFLFVNTSRIAEALSADPRQGRRLLQEFIGKPSNVRFDLDNPDWKPPADSLDEWDTELPHVDQRAFCFHKDETVAVLRLRTPVAPKTLAAVLAKRRAVRKSNATMIWHVFQNPPSFVWATGDGRIIVNSSSERLLQRYAKHAATYGWESLEPKALAAGRGAAPGVELFAVAKAPFPKHIIQLGTGTPPQRGFDEISGEAGKPQVRSPNAWAETVKRIKTVALLVDRNSDIPVRISIDAESQQAAKTVKAQLAKRMMTIRADLSGALVGPPNPRHRFPLAAWETTLMKQLLDGVDLKRTGKTVVLELRHTGGFPRLLEFAVRAAWRMSEDAASRFRSIKVPASWESK